MVPVWEDGGVGRVMRNAVMWVLGCVLACAPREPMLMQPLPPGYEYPWRAVSEARVRVGASVGVARAAVLVHEAIGLAARGSLPGAGAAAGSPSPPSMPSPARPVDLNLASVAELEALPRVGPAMVERIVAGRPYASVRGLRRVRGIGDATFAQLEPLVCVGCGEASPAAATSSSVVTGGSGEADPVPPQAGVH